MARLGSLRDVIEELFYNDIFNALSEFVDCSEYGIHEGPPKYPLRVSGVFSRPQFTMDYFEVGPVYKNSEVRFWIYRRNGDLWFGNENKAIPFADWCGGAVDRGLS